MSGALFDREPVGYVCGFSASARCLKCAKANQEEDWEPEERVFRDQHDEFDHVVTCGLCGEELFA